MFVATYACGKEKRAKVFRLLRSEKRWKKLLIYGFICRKASSAKWWLEWQIIFFILFVRSSRKIFISSQFLIRLRVNLEEFLLGSKASYIYYRRWRVEREWIRFFFCHFHGDISCICVWKSTWNSLRAEHDGAKLFFTARWVACHPELSHFSPFEY